MPRKHYYLLEIESDTNTDRIDALMMQRLYNEFRKNIRAWRYEEGKHPTSLAHTTPVLFDPVVHDGEEPPGYVPEYELCGNRAGDMYHERMLTCTWERGHDSRYHNDPEYRRWRWDDSLQRVVHP